MPIGSMSAASIVRTSCSLLRLLPPLVMMGSLLVGLPAVTLAQSTSGFTFTWGDGPKGKQQLKYFLEYGTPGFPGDRYRLTVGTQTTAIDRIAITYPDYYDGIFDPKAIEVRVGSGKGGFLSLNKWGKPVPLAEVKVDKENKIIDIVPVDPIPAGTAVEVVLSNVTNPDFGGTYFFNCRISSPGDIPLLRYIGTWIITIGS